MPWAWIACRPAGAGLFAHEKGPPSGRLTRSALIAGMQSRYSAIGSYGRHASRDCSASAVASVSRVSGSSSG
jgi:hypothetical protein